jgi:hypothetical protein
VSAVLCQLQVTLMFLEKKCIPYSGWEKSDTSVTLLSLGSITLRSALEEWLGSVWLHKHAQHIPHRACQSLPATHHASCWGHEHILTRVWPAADSPLFYWQVTQRHYMPQCPYYKPAIVTGLPYLDAGSVPLWHRAQGGRVLTLFQEDNCLWSCFSTLIALRETTEAGAFSSFEIAF